ncbi:hypothetical protein OE88DRAFT_1812398, partial [Heliocybe sulcata]
MHYNTCPPALMRLLVFDQTGDYNCAGTFSSTLLDTLLDRGLDGPFRLDLGLGTPLVQGLDTPLAPGLGVPPAPPIVPSKTTAIAPGAVLTTLLDTLLDRGLGMVPPARGLNTPLAPEVGAPIISSTTTAIPPGAFPTTLLDTPLDWGLPNVPPARGPDALRTSGLDVVATLAIDASPARLSAGFSSALIDTRPAPGLETSPPPSLETSSSSGTIPHASSASANQPPALLRRS